MQLTQDGQKVGDEGSIIMHIIITFSWCIHIHVHVPLEIKMAAIHLLTSSIYFHPCYEYIHNIALPPNDEAEHIPIYCTIAKIKYLYSYL